MKASTLPQASRSELEVHDLRIEQDTANYRIESGKLGDMQCRVVSSQSDSMMPSVQSWFELRRKASHSNLPNLHAQSSVSTDVKHELVETWHGSIDLDTYLSDRDELLTELSAVYLTLQAATLLNYLVQAGGHIAQLDERQFLVDERLHELPKLTYTGWMPSEDTSTPIESSDGLRVIARILYRCLTGSLPPSNEVPDTLIDDESTNLGFDNLLMHWVTEERELGALGQCALDALQGAKSEQSITDFIRDVYPHLQQATQQAITNATTQLLEERRLLHTVEKHRGKLKELRTRHQYLTGWLIDHEPELDVTSKNLEQTQAYTAAFKAYAEKVRSRLKRGLSDTHAMTGSNALRIAHDETTSSHSQDTPLRFTELVINFEDDASVGEDDNAVPSERSVPNARPVTPDHGQSMSSNESMTQVEPTPQSSALNIFVLVILSATILGVFFAWSLLSTHVKGEPSNQPVMFQKESK